MQVKEKRCHFLNEQQQQSYWTENDGGLSIALRTRWHEFILENRI
jgi:hypothetical protein